MPVFPPTRLPTTTTQRTMVARRNTRQRRGCGRSAAPALRPLVEPIPARLPPAGLVPRSGPPPQMRGRPLMTTRTRRVSQAIIEVVAKSVDDSTSGERRQASLPIPAPGPAHGRQRALGEVRTLRARPAHCSHCEPQSTEPSLSGISGFSCAAPPQWRSLPRSTHTTHAPARRVGRRLRTPLVRTRHPPPRWARCSTGHG